MSGATWHRRIPWDWLRRAYLDMRSSRFSKKRSSRAPLVVSGDAEAALGSMHYGVGAAFSYDKGEDFNLAKDYHVPLEELPEEVREALGPYMDSEGDRERAEWWQVHVRGYRAGNNIWELEAHWEMEPYANDVAHLDGVGFNRRLGMMELLADVRRSELVVSDSPVPRGGWDDVDPWTEWYERHLSDG